MGDDFIDPFTSDGAAGADPDELDPDLLDAGLDAEGGSDWEE